MTWVMLFTWPLMAAIQEISARIGRVTGDGIAGNIRGHYPRWLLLIIVALLVIANVINLGADLGAMTAALQLMLGGSVHLYVVGFAALCALLEVFLRYENYVRVLKWTAVSLFAYVATAFLPSMCPGFMPFATSSYPRLPGTEIVSSRSSPFLARRLPHTASSGSLPRRLRTSASIPPRIL